MYHEDSKLFNRPIEIHGIDGEGKSQLAYAMACIGLAKKYITIYVVFIPYLTQKPSSAQFAADPVTNLIHSLLMNDLKGTSFDEKELLGLNEKGLMNPNVLIGNSVILSKLLSCIAATNYRRPVVWIFDE